MHDFVTLNQGYKSLFDDAGKLSLILHIRPSYSYSMGAITKSQDQLKEALNTTSRVRIPVLTTFDIDLGIIKKTVSLRFKIVIQIHRFLEN